MTVQEFRERIQYLRGVLCVAELAANHAGDESSAIRTGNPFLKDDELQKLLDASAYDLDALNDTLNAAVISILEVLQHLDRHYSVEDRTET